MGSADNRRLILFSRLPTAGDTKTRLIPALGPDGAAACQRAMTEHVLAVARSVGVPLEVHAPAGDADGLRDWLGDDVQHRPQSGADLGERLHQAIAGAHQAGAKRIVVIGADIPGIARGHLEQAFAALHRCDAVLGPATDGGYYLIGLKTPAPELFQNIDWGGPDVLATTRERLHAAGHRRCLLPPLSDVDRPEDLPVWEAARAAGPQTERPAISVVIPALNEAANIGDCVASVRPGPDIEAIVVDAGSRDDTAALANAAGATVLQAPRGRAAQMNAGAEVASGDLLLFLHADSVLPDDWAPPVREAMGDPDISLGAFRLALSDPTMALRTIAFGANLRTRVLRLPYGDQGLFLRADSFHRHGGYRLLPLLEDVDLVQRLRETGRLCVLDKAVTTSSRRWRKLGILRTTWRNQRVIFGWLIGAAPERLAHIYRH